MQPPFQVTIFWPQITQIFTDGFHVLPKSVVSVANKQHGLFQLPTFAAI